MYQAFEATIDKAGNIQLSESVHLPAGQRALVIVMTEPPLGDTALASEASLAEIWNRPEEDEAWAHLQSET